MSWKKFFRGERLFETKKLIAPSVPSGTRIYAIGDVHGRLDLLNDLEQQIIRDLETAPADVLTIFLGDYVDRGPDSAGVLERLSADDFCTPICALRGNHEEVFLQFLSDASVLGSWRKFGGLETLHSYGVNVADAMRGAGFGRAQETLIETLPRDHQQFLEKTRLSVTVGDYFFCHAGAKPGVELQSQTAQALLWIRDEFLQFEGAFGKIVIHGHSPNAGPEIKKNRINIDTGAYASSVLTALVLEGESRRFLATSQGRASHSR